jgi:hypothetical protein
MDFSRQGSSNEILSLKTTTGRASRDGLLHPLLDPNVQESNGLRDPRTRSTGGGTLDLPEGSGNAGASVQRNQRTVLTQNSPRTRNELGFSWWKFLHGWRKAENILEPAALRTELVEMMRLRDADILDRLGGVSGIATAIARTIKHGDANGQSLLLGDSGV